MKVLILVLEFFDVRRIFLSLAKVFDLLVLLPTLALQLKVVLF